MNGQMRSIGQSGTAGVPCLVVAHSFGCLAVARRAAECGEGIAGALLVAPSDPDRWRVARDAIVRGPFGFPSIVVASETDPWLDIDEGASSRRAVGQSIRERRRGGPHQRGRRVTVPGPKGSGCSDALRAAADPRALAVAHLKTTSAGSISGRHGEGDHLLHRAVACRGRQSATRGSTTWRSFSGAAICRASAGQCSPPTECVMGSAFALARRSL